MDRCRQSGSIEAGAQSVGRNRVSKHTATATVIITVRPGLLAEGKSIQTGLATDKKKSNSEAQIS